MGKLRYQTVARLPLVSQPFSLSAADYDQDGDLDLYACVYIPSQAERQPGGFALPLPFHDANNGAANVLFSNEGNGVYRDVTATVGLEQNNRRFSWAAAWEDYDNDGDQDLYVANDFGRNNLYRNDGGRFVDVAASGGVEDTASGMSVSWADYDNDGWMDLYVGNMFSSAGSRITPQQKFMPQISDSLRDDYRRLARGNSLFRNGPGAKFQDVSVDAAVQMGRWAWGSKFVDINNDGLQDLLVANGFVTQEDTGDL